MGGGAVLNDFKQSEWTALGPVTHNALIWMRFSSFEVIFYLFTLVVKNFNNQGKYIENDPKSWKPIQKTRSVQQVLDMLW